jgi:hypothetical protein
MLKMLCVLSNKASILSLDIFMQGKPFSLVRQVKTIEARRFLSHPQTHYQITPTNAYIPLTSPSILV